MSSIRKVLTISGSSRPESFNTRLLKVVHLLDDTKEYLHYESLNILPVFAAESDRHPWPEEVLKWRSAIAEVDAIVICTPEYIHNLPAQIKSALEWIASSGELVGKPTLAMTYTPNSPRGERTMQSLLWSLGALDANVVAQVSIYQNEVKEENGKLVGDEETIDLLTEVLRML